MEQFGLSLIDSRAIMTWFAFVIGTGCLWMFVDGLRRKSVRNVGWLSIFPGWKRLDREDDPVVYWFHMLLYFLVGTGGLWLFGVSVGWLPQPYT